MLLLFFIFGILLLVDLLIDLVHLFAETLFCGRGVLERVVRVGEEGVGLLLDDFVFLPLLIDDKAYVSK